MFLFQFRSIHPPENVTEIKTNIFVTSFGPVSDTEMVSSSTANTADANPFHIYKSARVKVVQKLI